MSQIVDASEIRALAAGIERQKVMDIVRGATFVGTLMLGWISLHPFESLGDMQIGDVGTGNELATYAVFGGLSVLTVALAMVWKEVLIFQRSGFPAILRYSSSVPS